MGTLIRRFQVKERILICLPLLIVGLIFLLLGCGNDKDKFVTPLTPTETETSKTTVHRYEAYIDARFLPLPEVSEENRCWTSSLASTRSDAYRCTRNRVISDPCFIHFHPDAMVCPNDPRKTSDDIVFKYNLTQLPPSLSSKDNIWFMVLEERGGLLRGTGTTPKINDTFLVFHSCTEPSDSDHMTTQCRKGEGLQIYSVSEVWK